MRARRRRREASVSQRVKWVCEEGEQEARTGRGRCLSTSPAPAASSPPRLTAAQAIRVLRFARLVLAGALSAPTRSEAAIHDAHDLPPVSCRPGTKRSKSAVSPPRARAPWAGLSARRAPGAGRAFQLLLRPCEAHLHGRVKVREKELSYIHGRVTGRNTGGRGMEGTASLPLGQREPASERKRQLPAAPASVPTASCPADEGSEIDGGARLAQVGR